MFRDSGPAVTVTHASDPTSFDAVPSYPENFQSSTLTPYQFPQRPLVLQRSRSAENVLLADPFYFNMSVPHNNQHQDSYEKVTDSTATSYGWVD